MTNDDGGENDGPDEYPTEEELPDNPVTVDDVDPFIVDDEDFEDINEWAKAEWLASRTTNEDDEKYSYRDDIEATEGWPDDDVELPYDSVADPGGAQGAVPRRPRRRRR
jgi:hypothetical protein